MVRHNKETGTICFGNNNLALTSWCRLAFGSTGYAWHFILSMTEPCQYRPWSNCPVDPGSIQRRSHIDLQVYPKKGKFIVYVVEASGRRIAQLAQMSYSATD